MRDDNRLTIRLTSYWNTLRADRIIPSIENFHIHALEDVIGQCCIWRVEIADEHPSSPLYTYEYVGSSLKDALGRDMTGEKFTAQLENFPPAWIVSKIDTVLETKFPTSDEGEFVNELHKTVKYRSCLLPFGSPEGKITNILLGLSWSTIAAAYSPEW